MKILLTGANGFLGKRILEDLNDRGHNVVLMSRRAPDKKWDKFEWVQGDCNDLVSCINAMEGKNIDAVIHAAAVPSPTDTKETEMFDDIGHVADTMQTNVMGLYNMLQGALRAGIHVFVQTGSNCILGHERRISTKPLTWMYLPIDEDHPGEPEDSYSVSKICGEILMKAYSEAYGMKAYVLRSGWILDAERRKTVVANRPNPTIDISRVLNSYVAIEDCSMAHVLVAEAGVEGKLPDFACYYVHADDSLALEPSMELLRKFRPDMIDKLHSPLEGHASFFSNQRIKQAVGWESTISWRNENK